MDSYDYPENKISEKDLTDVKNDIDATQCCYCDTESHMCTDEVRGGYFTTSAYGRFIAFKDNL